ncbi:hypothetical protein [Nocardioides marmoriginsengisoli]|uniref:hypothetical protein n=1 Tax=Nocardioides marmoriginsengisoli TaxID=661483 RepID=UPI00160E7EF8|nr:hypothetical protein [Nocardioides marmoriginsengisoli]
MEHSTITLDDPQIVRDLAHHNQVPLLEQDGTLAAEYRGLVYLAPTGTAAA